MEGINLEKKYERILIKLSGGALASENGESFGDDNLEHITNEIISLTKIGVVIRIFMKVPEKYFKKILTDFKRNALQHYKY